MKKITDQLNALRQFKLKIIVEVVSSLLVILFIYTGITKLMDFKTFRLQLVRSPFIENIAVFIAYTLPIGELLIATALIIKQTRLLGLYLSFWLMTLFTGYIWLMLNYAYDLPCSCGGILAAMSWKDHLIFNGIFTLLAIIGIISEHKVIATRSLNKNPQTSLQNI